MGKVADFRMGFEPVLAILPGGTFEGGSENTNPFDDYGGDKAQSVRITVQSLAFVGGEKWHAPNSE